MIKGKAKEIIIRVIILMIGLTIAHLGVTLFLLANLGADPFNVFVQGAFRSLHKITDIRLLTHGNTHVKSEAGTGPNDLVAVVISDKINKKFSIVRIIVDFCFVGVGFLLGGSVGVGTLICGFLVGPVAGIFIPINKKIIDNIINKAVVK